MLVLDTQQVRYLTELLFLLFKCIKNKTKKKNYPPCCVLRISVNMKKLKQYLITRSYWLWFSVCCRPLHLLCINQSCSQNHTTCNATERHYKLCVCVFTPHQKVWVGPVVFYCILFSPAGTCCLWPNKETQCVQLCGFGNRRSEAERKKNTDEGMVK